MATLRRKGAIALLILSLACNIKDSSSLEKMYIILRSLRFTYQQLQEILSTECS